MPWIVVCLLGCILLATAGWMSAAQTATAHDPVVQQTTHPEAAKQMPSKQNLREAEDAYLAGAKKLERDDLNGAESDFKRAQKLDPENADYAIAISVARQHRVLELVQQAGKEKLSGNQGQAEKLLAQARAIDPENPLVLEHRELAMQADVVAPDAASGKSAIDQASGKSMDQAGNATSVGLAERAAMLTAGQARQPWSIQVPALASAIELQPSDEVKSFHIHGESGEVMRQVAAAYGIRVVIDSSVVPKAIGFDLDHVKYAQAMQLMKDMTNVILIPLDTTSVLVARNLPSNRLSLLPLVEETIYLPESTQDQINEIATVARDVFGVRQASAQVGTGSVVLRAPQDVIPVMNRVIEELVDSTGEVMVEVKMYEITSTHTANGGANIPTAAGIYNVDQAATSLVNANSALVQQAIAQGLVSASASNLTIAGELIASGLVQSSLLSSTIGAVGGGTTLTGITETGNIALHLGMNASETKALDDVQLRVIDRQPATIREGSRYPIVSSTYTSGLSTAASALGKASINGVSVASLLSQYAGGSSATIPQVTYEDLGITLSATPTILKSGRVRLLLDLKIEALSGSTSDGNPILENRAFKSDITVGEGESALLVSSVSKIETAAMSGIPGLSELPGFQMPVTEDAQKDTSQLVIQVTPHVVRRRSNLVATPRFALPPQSVN